MIAVMKRMSQTKNSQNNYAHSSLDKRKIKYRGNSVGSNPTLTPRIIEGGEEMDYNKMFNVISKDKTGVCQGILASRCPNHFGLIDYCEDEADENSCDRCWTKALEDIS